MDLQLSDGKVTVDAQAATLFAANKLPETLDITKKEFDLIKSFAEDYIRMDETYKKPYTTPGEWQSGSDAERWYQTNIHNLNLPTLIKLISTANTLGFETLINICSYDIAQRIKGTSTEEIRIMFGIENDFSPEEEEAIKHELNWSHD
jgi:S-phase kinase-associated protein 1